MISSNNLFTFMLHHHLNGLCNKNLRSIKDLMRTRKPAGNKFKHGCEDSPNLVILTKSATSGNVQMMFAHASVSNKSLGKYITAFALAVSLEALKVVSINIDIAFAIAGDNIRIPVNEVLLRAAIGDLTWSKRQRYWVVMNSVLLPPLLMEAAILDRKTAVVNLLKVFTK